MVKAERTYTSFLLFFERIRRWMEIEVCLGLSSDREVGMQTPLKSLSKWQFYNNLQPSRAKMCRRLATVKLKCRNIFVYTAYIDVKPNLALSFLGFTHLRTFYKRIFVYVVHFIFYVYNMHQWWRYELETALATDRSYQQGRTYRGNYIYVLRLFRYSWKLKKIEIFSIIIITFIPVLDGNTIHCVNYINEQSVFNWVGKFIMQS